MEGANRSRLERGSLLLCGDSVFILLRASVISISLGNVLVSLVIVTVSLLNSPTHLLAISLWSSGNVTRIARMASVNSGSASSNLPCDLYLQRAKGRRRRKGEWSTRATCIVRNDGVAASWIVTVAIAVAATVAVSASYYSVGTRG